MSWKVLAQSAIGTSHEKRGQECQDSCRTSFVGPDQSWLAVAVSDGAGSAARAGIGARLVCTELLAALEHQSFVESWTQEQVLVLLQAVRDKLQQCADTEGYALRDYACTVLLAVVGPQASLFVQIGDGAIVLPDRVAFWPEPSEYANVTDFLTDAEFQNTVQWLWQSGEVPQFAILSDGLQRVALDYSTKTAYPKFFEPLFRRLSETDQPSELIEQYAAFLNSAAINARTDDDKTLVLAVRCP